MKDLLLKTNATLPIDAKSWSALDLSAKKVQDLGLDLSKQADIENWFSAQVNQDKVLFGGYMELRSWYGRNPGFVGPEETRNLHIGLDIWAPKGQSVFAVLDGTIHSFANNNAPGDYGYTLILEHKIAGATFFTLYGHLAKFEKDFTIGEKVTEGQEIAKLGSWNENGNWPSHLHFQIITNIGEYRGDYPGTCFTKEMEKYEHLCPDPQFLLNIPS